jgi:hypothetical protein
MYSVGALEHVVRLRWRPPSAGGGLKAPGTSDLIINVALKSLYIHDVGGKKITTMIHNCHCRQRHLVGNR